MFDVKAQISSLCNITPILFLVFHFTCNRRQNKEQGKNITTPNSGSFHPIPPGALFWIILHCWLIRDTVLLALIKKLHKKQA